MNRTGPVDRAATEVLREWLLRGAARAVRMNKADDELHLRELEVIIDDQNPLVTITPLDLLERQLLWATDDDGRHGHRSDGTRAFRRGKYLTCHCMARNAPAWHVRGTSLEQVADDVGAHSEHDDDPTTLKLVSSSKEGQGAGSRGGRSVPRLVPL